jgi:molybdopterin molybdotransferase
MQNNHKSQKDMLGRSAILPLKAALEKLRRHLAALPAPGEEIVPLEEGLGRFLAQAVTAKENLPAQPRSTMDGYAVKAADSFGAAESRPVYLKISGEVLMGTMPEAGPGSLECHKIATGGFLPPGTDAVVMLEHTIKVDSTLIELIKAVSPGENLLAAGDDLREGEPVLAAGKKLRPQELGLLAGLGFREVAVHKTIRVGIFSTGDEIVPFQESPPPGKIRDMNGVHLSALTRQLGGCPQYYGITADVESSFSSLLHQALAENDLVLFSGSSSVGTRDLGERVIGNLPGPGTIIHGVAIKPGKPVIVALSGNKPIFGLPGHPVSAAVAFDLFVRPTMVHLSGHKGQEFPEKRRVPARLTRNLNSAAGRTDFVRVSLSPSPDGQGYAAQPVLGKSGALSTMVKADGYLVIAEESQGLYQEAQVDVFLFD